MAVSQKDIAAKAGVSCATVSRVIRNPQSVRPQLANRVYVVMREMGLEIRGAELFEEKCTNILVVVSDFTYSLYGGFIAGIAEITNEKGLNLVLCNSFGRIEVEQAAVSNACRGGYAGVIFLTAEDTTAYRDMLRSISIPVVLLNRKIEGLDYDSVLLAHFETARVAIRHLLEMNCQRIAMLTTDAEPTNTRAEKAGFIDALLQRGISYASAESSIFYYPNTYQGGFDFAQRFAAEKMQYDALYIISSEQTVGFIQHAMVRSDHRLAQVQVLALNRNPILTGETPRLITMEQPVKEMGRKAVEVLLERLIEPDRERMNIQYNAMMTAGL